MPGSPFGAFDAARLRVYTRNFAPPPGEITLTPRSRIFLVTCKTGPAELDAWIADRHAKSPWRRWRARRRRRFFMEYFEPIVRALARYAPNAAAGTTPGDIVAHQPQLFSLAKCRPILRGADTNALTDAPGYTIFPLNYARHWGDVRKVARRDRPFSTKAPTLVFRAAANASVEWADDDGQPSYPRGRFLEFYVERASARLRAQCDIGFVEVEEDRNPRSTTLIRSAQLERAPLSIAEQLESKYLLSLEGIDVATGLKWMMASNSLVLMPRPRSQSWFAESLLEPWRHYVPLAEDCADLEERLDWCEANPRRAEEIVSEASAFLSEFMDPRREDAMRRAVLLYYVERAQFRLEGLVRRHDGASNVVGAVEDDRSMSRRWLEAARLAAMRLG